MERDSGSPDQQCGSGWLNLGATNGTATTAAPASLLLTVSPAGLQPGTCKAQIVISGASVTSATVNVTLQVASASGQTTIELSQTGVQLTLTAGAAEESQVGIVNAGSGTWPFHVLHSRAVVYLPSESPFTTH